MKVLFLDIDGVLNTENTRESIPHLQKDYTGLDGRLVDRYLKWLLDKDCEVVLSSDWRKYEPFQQHLIENGIVWLDKTPVFNAHRGMEIAWWLNQHPEVTECAIIDDNCRMKPLGRCLVQTSPYHGMQDKHLRKINKLLGYE